MNFHNCAQVKYLSICSDNDVTHASAFEFQSYRENHYFNEQIEQELTASKVRSIEKRSLPVERTGDDVLMQTLNLT